MEQRQVRIPLGDEFLVGHLTWPADACGVVLFAHGSGSGRLSPRNQYVAAQLNAAGLCTLLIDLLTLTEEREDAITGHLRFDIELLSGRLTSAIEWLQGDETTRDLPIGCFGASTGAAAALVAASSRPDAVGAVVSRGGRPDLAGDRLAHVQAPTLLIVGDQDRPVVPLNDAALKSLATPIKELVLVRGATHLFQEPGALEQVAKLAANWFRKHLCPSRQHEPIP